MNVRQPAVAGSFYPEQAVVLRKGLEYLLHNAKPHAPMPKAIVAPHAGYAFSGPVAASAYASLEHSKNNIKKIVILGPAHTLYFKGIAFDPVEYFATPLGDMKQDKGLLNKIINLPYVHNLPQAHEKEHCLEVQLPFCQMLFPEASILPLVVGETSEEKVAELISLLWGNEDTLFIISSDLSHYLPYESAKKTDSLTCLGISTLDNELIPHQSACGYYPLRGFLYFARQNHIYGRLIDLRNSGDTAGNKTRVVGYAAYHFYQNLLFNEYCGDEILSLARESLTLGTQNKPPMTFEPQEYHELLQVRIPTFVTLKKNGILRGCTGTLRSHQLLGDNIIFNALSAGFKDHRFPPVQGEELKKINISVSILSPLETLHFNSEEALINQLRQGIDGLVLSCDNSHATFLPSVWENFTKKQDFLNNLKLKMGLPAHFWSAKMQAQRYTTEIISEE